MNILAVEPYYGGSHRFFIDNWIKRSRHRWKLLTEPPYKWKWRMRHGSVSFSRRYADGLSTNDHFDLLFCTDMLNLAEFRGLAPESVAALPTLIYFHENQLTYPNRKETERDMHFAFSNFTSCLAADRIWFNSRFHREEFLNALENWLQRMPPPDLSNEVEAIKLKSNVRYPGINLPQLHENLKTDRPTILWAARWEHDKNPEQFFEAIGELSDKDVDFNLIVLGESFEQTPAVFEAAHKRYRDQILHFGYAESREKYNGLLSRSDIVVSTALHEFFGISIAEAIAAGVVPLLPDRLAYPEILERCDRPAQQALIYDGSTSDLVEKLISLLSMIESNQQLEIRAKLHEQMKRFSWDELIKSYDDELAAIAGK